MRNLTKSPATFPVMLVEVRDPSFVTLNTRKA